MIDVTRFRIYEIATGLAEDIYKITKDFPAEEKYGVTSQIRRAVISIGANIAEGAGRSTKTDFHRFLFIALGSLYETKHHLDMSVKLSFIEKEKIADINDKLDKLKRMIINFIKNSRNHQAYQRSPVALYPPKI